MGIDSNRPAAILIRPMGNADVIELPNPGGRVDLLVMAAECSGDELGAQLIREYTAINPGAIICAIGGDGMRLSGAQFLFPLANHAAMGIWEVLRQGCFFLRFFRAAVHWICRHRPRRVCFIDSPSLHLRIAKRLTKLHISVHGGGDVALYHYVAPQVWAWGPNRRFAMASMLDALAVLFPFEVAVFSDTNLPTTCVGHPFARRNCPSPVCYEENHRILLLPGSRRAMVCHNFPTMLDTFARLVEDDGRWEAICPYPTEQIHEILRQKIRRHPSLAEKIHPVPIANGMVRPIGAQLALVCAGTMSLRCAMEGIPGIVICRVHPITHAIGRHLVRVRFLAMANLLLGYECYPEYVQRAANPATLAEKLRQFVHGRREFAEVARELHRHLRGGEMTPGEWLSAAQPRVENGQKQVGDEVAGGNQQCVDQHDADDGGMVAARDGFDE
jgi:lipid-A-disaccharide synthase